MFLDCDRMKHTVNSSLTGENKKKYWIIYQNTETSETVYFNGNMIFACVDNWDEEKNWAPSCLLQL